MGQAWHHQHAGAVSDLPVNELPINELDVIYVLSAGDVPHGAAALTVEPAVNGFLYRLERDILCYESPVFGSKSQALDSAFLYIRKLGIDRVYQILPDRVQETMPKLLS